MFSDTSDAASLASSDDNLAALWVTVKSSTDQ
jgi:hypothetical protein